MVTKWPSLACSVTKSVLRYLSMNNINSSGLAAAQSDQGGHRQRHDEDGYTPEAVTVSSDLR